MGNDSVYSSVFSLLTGLHFFHLVVGLFLLSLYYCSCSFQCKIDNLVTIRSSEVDGFIQLKQAARVTVRFLVSQILRSPTTGSWSPGTPPCKTEGRLPSRAAPSPPPPSHMEGAKKG